MLWSAAARHQNYQSIEVDAHNRLWVQSWVNRQTSNLNWAASVHPHPRLKAAHILGQRTRDNLICDNVAVYTNGTAKCCNHQSGGIETVFCPVAGSFYKRSTEAASATATALICLPTSRPNPNTRRLCLQRLHTWRMKSTEVEQKKWWNTWDFGWILSLILCPFQISKSSDQAMIS